MLEEAEFYNVADLVALVKQHITDRDDKLSQVCIDHSLNFSFFGSLAEAQIPLTSVCCWTTSPTTTAQRGRLLGFCKLIVQVVVDWQQSRLTIMIILLICTANVHKKHCRFKLQAP